MSFDDLANFIFNTYFFLKHDISDGKICLVAIALISNHFFYLNSHYIELDFLLTQNIAKNSIYLFEWWKINAQQISQNLNANKIIYFSKWRFINVFL